MTFNDRLSHPREQHVCAWSHCVDVCETAPLMFCILGLPLVFEVCPVLPPFFCRGAGGGISLTHTPPPPRSVQPRSQLDSLSPAALCPSHPSSVRVVALNRLGWSPILGCVFTCPRSRRGTPQLKDKQGLRGSVDHWHVCRLPFSSQRGC